MGTKAKKLLLNVGVLIFWLLVWDVVAALVNIKFILPTVKDVLLTLGRLILTFKFWHSLIMSLLRIILGFTMGVAMAVVLALFASISTVSHALIAPVMTIARSTPVASFIMLLWLLVGGESIPVLIAVLMVLPVVWQSVYNGITSPPQELTEMAQAFGLSTAKRLRYITLPSTLKYALPTVVTASGLAWKAGIAAEIITYTKNSIGQEIANAKNYFEGAELLAWTLAVILLSLLLEIGIKALSNKGRRLWE
jgi:NitT/TauT family transport system permease protein